LSAAAASDVAPMTRADAADSCGEVGRAQLAEREMERATGAVTGGQKS